ncbi:hypothetical protein CH298_13245 [Rhodococcoides fascians]|nr:hypothetical protein CH303_13125 [Rhodococcus fascians]OZF18251.1 hypothetical protein CH298_13245 [Rhodococcus fascians]OZF21702.1 hypothetical protein CH297_13140 [Rhodococcus fascians]OZF67327.1 hypothetical protein CH308_13040 [Rhodococcus fascians]OZF70516.1 hypothetical protein CH307_13235 [Rhodococcus fascians]
MITRASTARVTDDSVVGYAAEQRLELIERLETIAAVGAVIIRVISILESQHGFNAHTRMGIDHFSRSDE